MPPAPAFATGAIAVAILFGVEFSSEHLEDEAEAELVDIMFESGYHFSHVGNLILRFMKILINLTSPLALLLTNRVS